MSFDEIDAVGIETAAQDIIEAGNASRDPLSLGGWGRTFCGNHWRSSLRLSRSDFIIAESSKSGQS
jgi:hypothetical protein